MHNKNKNEEAVQIHFAALASDTALFTIFENELLVRLIRINRPPFYKDAVGLPGGLLLPNETADEAALRHLETKTGVSSKNVYIEQLYTFSDVKRDPRNRVVAVAYIALVPWKDLTQDEQLGDITKSWWVPVKKVPKLAYDHNKIIGVALRRLTSEIGYSTVINKLLSNEFTLIELERAYETILDEKIDRRNFRKKINKLKLVVSLNKKIRGFKWRPAMLYAFKSNKVEYMNIL